MRKKVLCVLVGLLLSLGTSALVYDEMQVFYQPISETAFQKKSNVKIVEKQGRIPISKTDNHDGTFAYYFDHIIFGNSSNETHTLLDYEPLVSTVNIGDAHSVEGTVSGYEVSIPFNIFTIQNVKMEDQLKQLKQKTNIFFDTSVESNALNVQQEKKNAVQDTEQLIHSLYESYINSSDEIIDTLKMYQKLYALLSGLGVAVVYTGIIFFMKRNSKREKLN